MDKELVIVVPSEKAAYHVAKSLRGLDDEGSIELYAATVVAKTAGGALTIKEEDDVAAGWATALGLSTGALIGLLAGPVGAMAGAAIAAAVNCGSHSSRRG